MASGEGMSLKNRNRAALLVVLCVPLILSPRRDTAGTMVFPAVPKQCLHNVSAASGTGGETIYSVADLSYQKSSERLITDMVLSFNYPAAKLTRDDLRHYRVTRSDYSFISGAGSLGDGCALFFKREHGVTLETQKNAWLGSCGDLGSFTIEFRLNPSEVRDGSVLFSRTGFFSGRKRGIEITIRNGRTCAALYGVFEKPGGQILDILLARGRRIQKQRWGHFSLSFDRQSGKLTKYLDGEEEETVYVTESGEAFNGVYAPSFGSRNTDGSLRCLDSPPVRIGENYSGMIDEFRISYRHFADLEKSTAIAYRNYHSIGRIGRIPFNVEGVVTSPVFRFPETGTRVLEFRWKEKLEKDTFIWMQFRISDRNFTPDSIDPAWRRVDNNQKKIYMAKDDDGFLRGKYYQWRAHLVASPDGRRAPSLYGIELDYRLDLAPDPPRFVEAAAAGGRAVVIRWKKNMDHDIMGYRIYYGTVPNRYDGILSVVNGGRITNALSAGTAVEVTVTDAVIEENRAREPWGKLTFPFLNNTVLYYFAVSAYDSYKPDTPHNHESALSTPVTVRPYEGSEIR